MNKNLSFNKSVKFDCSKLGNIGGGQDGAIWGGYIFRIDTYGNCAVIELESLSKVSEFVLGSCDTIVPHSNSVCFGNEYFDEGDEFPLLYANVYNNYKNSEDRKEGVCCVYRITKKENVFSAQLVQIIKINFTNNTIWRSENIEDVRPYGNFVIDNENDILYAFVMRDEDYKTRVFSFRLPKLCDGNNKNIVLLNEEDIIDMFDCEYVEYMQGAAFDNGYIYSLYGFDEESPNKPTLSIIDTKNKKTAAKVELGLYGLVNEPELIEVYNEKVFFSDAHGDLYIIKLDV